MDAFHLAGLPRHLELAKPVPGIRRPVALAFAVDEREVGPVAQPVEREALAFALERRAPERRDGHDRDLDHDGHDDDAARQLNDPWRENRAHAIKSPFESPAPGGLASACGPSRIRVRALPGRGRRKPPPQ